jgi:hypothetical protein
MSPTLEEQIERLKSTIAQMEEQRDSLGDEFVDHAMLPFQQKLSELITLLQAGEAAPPAEPEQQRKMVTLLFMDIVGSTHLTQHLDPEDVMTTLDGALKRLAEPVELYVTTFAARLVTAGESAPARPPQVSAASARENTVTAWIPTDRLMRSHSRLATAGQIQNCQLLKKPALSQIP